MHVRIIELKFSLTQHNNTARPSSSERIRELKIDSTLWATPAKIINLLDFKPEKLSIKT